MKNNKIRHNRGLLQQMHQQLSKLNTNRFPGFFHAIRALVAFWQTESLFYHFARDVVENPFFCHKGSKTQRKTFQFCETSCLCDFVASLFGRISRRYLKKRIGHPEAYNCKFHRLSTLLAGSATYNLDQQTAHRSGDVPSALFSSGEVRRSSRRSNVPSPRWLRPA